MRGRAMKKECVLYNRECTNCGECEICDLDPKKKCDNCGKCLEADDDYNTVDVDLTLEENEDPEMLSYEELFPEKAFIGENNFDDDNDDYDDDYYEDFNDFDDFDDRDNFYEDEDFDTEDDGDLRQDFGELF